MFWQRYRYAESNYKGLPLKRRAATKFKEVANRQGALDQIYYQKVLGPGAELAGPLAEQLRTGVLPEESVEWLKKNFWLFDCRP